MRLKPRRILALPKIQAIEEEGKARSLGRRLVSGALICLTGGIALSALDDLIVYQSCSSKAMERASKNQAVVEAIGEPIVRGPWYNASLAIAHRRHSVSCTFPVSGPHGSGMLQLKAVHNGDATWFPLLRSREWDILIMEALLHVPGNQKKDQTFRISIADSSSPAACKPCTTNSPQPCAVVQKN